ncbi:hypothetical protein FF125_06285 [Aureibaculum algae]|uniref:Uncharacterized protein n=1 Tax=Aureibaculum algae TaxID=2584122 RepID=A0A5B7TS98_9FLAO|nr:hypothetical protein [Aureibaculum algae]QCX38054.1 hypothetical protein FF125_06285 [Aureibaculum algae]
MKEFNKSDIEALDFIIDQCLKTSFSVSADDLIKSGHIKLTDEKGYGTLTPDFDASKEFTRYLGILKKYELCKCNSTKDGEFASANSNTLNFQKQGGFKALYKDLKDKRNRDKLEFEKSKVDLELSKETLKEFPKTRKRAKWAIIISGIAIFLQLIEWIVKLMSS